MFGQDYGGETIEMYKKMDTGNECRSKRCLASLKSKPLYRVNALKVKRVSLLSYLNSCMLLTF